MLAAIGQRSGLEALRAVLVDGFGLQAVLDPQDPEPEQLASRLNGAVDALIRAAEG
jgi:hypothetical protein